MEPCHRERIQSVIPQLLEWESRKEFQGFCKELVLRGIYDSDMICKIVGDKSNKKDQALILFSSIHTRGPNAFHGLVDSLSKVGKHAAVRALTDSGSTQLVAQEGLEESQPTSEETFNLDESDCSRDSREGTPDDDENKTPEESMHARVIRNELEQTKEAVSINFTEEIKEPWMIPVVPASKLNNGNDLNCYKMKSNPRGLALIINNVDFCGDPSKTRHGAEVDGKTLKHTLKSLGYDVYLYQNVTKMELTHPKTGILTTFINRFYEIEVDSLIVSINSHGTGRDLVTMCDPPSRVPSASSIDLWEDVYSRFNNKNFPIFAGKPKIFLINACRGRKSNKPGRVLRTTQTDYVAPTSALTSGNQNLLGCSEYTDFFQLYSTVPDYVSIRDIDKGTWFLQAFHIAVAFHAHNHDFIGITRKVGEYIESLVDEDNGKQSCVCSFSAKSQQLYFNPGI